MEILGLPVATPTADTSSIGSIPAALCQREVVEVHLLAPVRSKSKAFPILITFQSALDASVYCQEQCQTVTSSNGVTSHDAFQQLDSGSYSTTIQAISDGEVSVTLAPRTAVVDFCGDRSDFPVVEKSVIVDTRPPRLAHRISSQPTSSSSYCHFTLFADEAIQELYPSSLVIENGFVAAFQGSSQLM